MGLWALCACSPFFYENGGIYHGTQLESAYQEQEFLAVYHPRRSPAGAVVTDPTTAGVSDSDQAMTYEEPKKKGE